MDASAAAKLAARKARLAAWKQKHGGAVKAENGGKSIENGVKTEGVKQEKEEKEEVKKGGGAGDGDVAYVDPLDAYFDEQEKAAKRDIEKSLEREREEAEIVAKGGHIEDTKGEFLEDELQRMVAANKRCYVCKKFGHTKAECPVKRCLFCFEVGHVQKDCEKYTEELKRRAEEEKKQKRQKFYQEKKNRRREEVRLKLACRCEWFLIVTCFSCIADAKDESCHRSVWL